MITNRTNEKELVYPELSYMLMGILFEVDNKLGTKFQEKHYQRAIEIKLKELHIPFKREEKVAVQFENQPLGDFFLDFIRYEASEMESTLSISEPRTRIQVQYLAACSET